MDRLTANLVIHDALAAYVSKLLRSAELTEYGESFIVDELWRAWFLWTATAYDSTAIQINL